MYASAETRASLDEYIDVYLRDNCGDPITEVKYIFPTALLRDWEQAAGINSRYSTVDLIDQVGLVVRSSITKSMEVSLTPVGKRARRGYFLELPIDEQERLWVPKSASWWGLFEEVDLVYPTDQDLNYFSRFLQEARRLTSGNCFT